MPGFHSNETRQKSRCGNPNDLKGQEDPDLRDCFCVNLPRAGTWLPLPPTLGSCVSFGAERFLKPLLSSLFARVCTEPAMLANLIHSWRRVQQLLVREIFLLGMSDGSLPMRDLKFP